MCMFQTHFMKGYLEHYVRNGSFRLKLVPHDLADDKSTLVQIINGLVQSGNKPGRCWPVSMSPYIFVNRPFPWKNNSFSNNIVQQWIILTQLLYWHSWIYTNQVNQGLKYVQFVESMYSNTNRKLWRVSFKNKPYFDGVAQDSSISISDTMEIYIAILY